MIQCFFSSSLVDIADCAVVILTESIEKHDRNVYEMAADPLTHEERAAIFSRVLGKPITYEQQSIENFYKAHIGFGMSHSSAYCFASLYLDGMNRTTTPQLAIILGRPLRTFEEWLKENAKAFQ